MKFSQSFILYHGCGRCYLDGTNELIANKEGCIMPTNNPFWKRPEDSFNRISKSTRSELKKKTYANLNYCKKYFTYVKLIDSKNYEFLSTYESDYSSEEDSASDYSDIESKLPDKLPDDNKVNVITTTGEDLIIDENTAQNPDNISNNK